MRYGFEAEWAVGAGSLVAKLHEAGLCGMSELHNYHCRCEQCSFTSGFAYRAQRDSSCDGEIISSPFTYGDADDDDNVKALCDFAVDVDAEPGMSAGCHVHVNTSKLNAASKRDLAFTAFVLWEPALMFLSAGRFAENRANNSMLSTSLALRNPYGDNTISLNTSGGTRRPTWMIDDDLKRYDPVDLLNDINLRPLLRHRAFNSDRHANLNMNTGHPTWEFRLWNATRAAWRIKMFAGLSCAFMTPKVLIDLLDGWSKDFQDYDPEDSEPATALVPIIGKHDSGLAALMERQIEYNLTTGPSVPSYFAA